MEPGKGEVEALYKLGVLFQGREKRDKSILCYQKVLGLQPDHFKAHYNLAVCLMANGDMQGR